MVMFNCEVSVKFIKSYFNSDGKLMSFLNLEEDLGKFCWKEVMKLYVKQCLQFVILNT